MRITAVIVAGGKGTRMGADKNKVFLKIMGKEVLFYTISAFEKNNRIDNIIFILFIIVVLFKFIVKTIDYIYL